MGQLNYVDSDDLRDWLDEVESKESTLFLMIAIAYDEGASVTELASWYDRPSDEIQDWIDRLESGPIVLPVAEREGVAFDELADRSGLGRKTVIDWFASLEAKPITQAANIVHRYSQEDTGPLIASTESQVQYLDYEAIEEHGWSIDDDNLFEIASDADLDAGEYGRFLVEPGETILEAAENRGLSWPYACRGGACANCAVIVKEGDVAMPGQTILSGDQVERLNARLTCVGVPATAELKLIMNVQFLDELEELRLPSPMADSDSPV